MANNYYTSHRVYASRGYKSKYKTKRTPFEQGMGYVEPEEFGLTRSEFKKLYSEWEKKLQKSGFTDIEYRSPTHTGHFTPFFRQNGSTATFMRLYDSSKEEYYRLATHFDAHMREIVKCPETGLRRSRWFHTFGDEAEVYKTLWYLHIEGVPYRAVAKAFSGQPTKWVRNLKPIPKALIQSRSVFWAHDHTHKVLDLFWVWAKDESGFDDPR
jgi:hypothetical protein